MPILGLRGTDNMATNERPQSWRKGIVLFFPNGEVPLMALAARGKEEEVSDYKFNWFEKTLPVRRMFINNAGGYTSASTSLTVDDGVGGTAATNAKLGTVLMNERTFEHMICQTTAPGADAVTVGRGKGSIAAAAMNDNDPLLIVGSAYEDGSSASGAVGYDPTLKTNVTQIFNDSLQLTRRAMKVQTRTGDQYMEKKRETLLQHMIGLEWSAFFGDFLDEAGSIGAVRRTKSGGMYYWVTTNVHDAGGTVSYFSLMDFFEDDFRYGSSEKMLFCGSTLINALTKLAKLEMTMNAVPGEQSYGLKITEVITPFGVLYVKNHPLLSDHPTFRQWGFGIDFDYFKIRYLDDTTFVPHVEVPGTWQRQDTFYTDLGWEVSVEKAHFLIKNMTKAI